ncbi:MULTISPECIES: MauE/DoxX family redox-associated membrane protein [Corynebacterium]|uniref:MauE/DoxX family redox-associated membrane protein n=1 Tax=Corynebacterium TaxID=1716 RepID=UPI001EF18FB5|nr:MauE/DoxX family redox-associated membrane protein [Corynebacterium kefirresidentii]MCG7240638.1 DoxX family membrane protein [Corynebacterium kefirresidentii]MCG7282844.1 DoxX family membrane protein [Corynebacterium kefirresidentii]MCG7449593.1 DoxX family membrane protein [Corynebacterium kefirresidentii]MCG7451975.1 DoxX family membrane protein [Corynebacterium kefirresidentii]
MSSKINGKLVLDVISFIARFGMAWVWIEAGVHKLGKTLDMTQAIKGYGIFTPEWAGYLATVIGPLEVIGGVLLLLGLFLRRSSIVATIVLLLFMVGIAQAWARGLDIDCGCFGYDAQNPDRGMDYAKTLLRDAAYLFLTVWTIKRPFTKFALHP